jgi:hypothetical protein
MLLDDSCSCSFSTCGAAVGRVASCLTSECEHREEELVLVRVMRLNACLPCCKAVTVRVGVMVMLHGYINRRHA